MTELCFNTFNRSAYLGIDPDLPGQIHAAADAGFTLFGPDTFSLRAWCDGGRSINELADLLAGRGMRCFEIAALHAGSAAESLPAAEQVAEWARVLQPEWVLTNVGVPIDEKLFATFDTMCDILASAGCRPAVEYLPWTPAHSIATTQALVDHVGRDRAKILFDVWHHFRGPDTWAELEAAPLDLVAYVQFDDAYPVTSDDLTSETESSERPPERGGPMGERAAARDGGASPRGLTWETLERRAFPGDGEFDLDRYCAIMRNKGFDGVVSVEVLNGEWRANPDLGAFARRAFDSSRRFWP